MKRKDNLSNHVQGANDIIAKATSKFSKVTLIKGFYPSNNMYHDCIHLNTYIGIPALVQHIQNELNIKMYDSLMSNVRLSQGRDQQYTHPSRGSPPMWQNPVPPCDYRLMPPYNPAPQLFNPTMPLYKPPMMHGQHPNNHAR